MTDFAATWQIIRVKSTDRVLNRSNFSGAKARPGTAWALSAEVVLRITGVKGG